jgi:hypothetical protein
MGRKHPPDCNHCAAVRRPKSPEWRANIAASLTGNPNHGMKRPGVAAQVAAKRPSQKGKPHPPGCAHCVAISTRGGNTYAAVHGRMNKILPKVCAMADETCKGRLEVALRYHGDIEVEGSREDGALFSVRVEDYWRLCRSHHARYDMFGHNPA